MATLPTVEVPGFREALKKERSLRDRAFLGGNEIVCGVVVRQLSLRTSLFLEHAQNGFFIPFRFDDDLEVLAHALQVLYFSSPDWKEPEVKPFTIWSHWTETLRQQRFQRKALRGNTPSGVVKEVREWIDEAMMDCPAGKESEVPKQSYVSYPASLLDVFAAANYHFTYSDILDMPLKRLWQHYRLAVNRVYEAPLANPSDVIAVEHIGKVAA